MVNHDGCLSENNNYLAHLQGMYTAIFQTHPYIIKYLDIKTFTKKKHNQVLGMVKYLIERDNLINSKIPKGISIDDQLIQRLGSKFKSQMKKSWNSRENNENTKKHNLGFLPGFTGSSLTN